MADTPCADGHTWTHDYYGDDWVPERGTPCDCGEKRWGLPHEMDKRSRGLYGKFIVRRTDGTDAPGAKHDGCEYFVLDLTHDPFALPAIAAYAGACESEYPQLAAELRAKALSR